VRGTRHFRQLTFKRWDLRALRQIIGPQRCNNCLYVFFGDVLPPIGDEGVGHGFSFMRDPIRCRLRKVMFSELICFIWCFKPENIEKPFL
jgi:hypothetical protein